MRSHDDAAVMADYLSVAPVLKVHMLESSVMWTHMETCTEHGFNISNMKQ